VLRADWHFVHKWDALFEVRWLHRLTRRQRKRVLMGLHATRADTSGGVGYNFTDFSDDLTQLDFKYQGLFINLIGKM
jgi:hypothetical protein